jgi:hypothetical protein
MSDGDVVLVMVEGRRWDGSAERLQELRNKINSYIEFVVGGRFRELYPTLSDKPVRLELRCVEAPDDSVSGLLNTAGKALARYQMSLSVRLIGFRPSG